MASFAIKKRDGTSHMVLVDDSDLDAVLSMGRWCILSAKAPYVMRSKLPCTKPRQYLYLHRWLMNPPDFLVVDHINGNRLDNRRVNLRVCTHTENHCNSQIRSDNKTGVKCVSYRPESGLYYASVRKNGVIHQRYFRELAEAEDYVKRVRAPSPRGICIRRGSKMMYVNLIGYQALVTYLASPLPAFHASYDAKHGWLYLKLLTLEISVYRVSYADGWRTVH